MRALNSSGYKTRGGTSDGGVGGGVGAFSWWKWGEGGKRGSAHWK